MKELGEKREERQQELITYCQLEGMRYTKWTAKEVEKKGGLWLENVAIRSVYNLFEEHPEMLCRAERGGQPSLDYIMRVLADDKKRRDDERAGAGTSRQAELQDVRGYNVDQVLYEVEKEVRSCDLD